MTAPTLTNMKYYIVVPQAATNLVTNPTPYRALTGYTAFDPDIAGTIAIALDDTYTRRGPRCVKITTLGSHDAGVYFSSVTGADGTTYTFSADILTTAGEPMVIAICSDVGGTILASTTFNATGYWQRKEVSLTGTAGNAGTWYLHVYRDGASSNAHDIYVDGLQFETGGTATTFFSGDTQGFGYVPREFYWDGTPHASTSRRTGYTRAGGRLLDISTYATVAEAFGLGDGNYSQVYTLLANGAGFYQRYLRNPRNFSLLLHYTGSMSDIQDDRNTILDACRPDHRGYAQPLIIRYQGEDSSGNEATNPVDIVCIPQTSHMDPAQECAFNEDILNFTVLDGYLAGAYKEGKELDLGDTISDSDYVVYRDADGVWKSVNNGGVDLTGEVRTIAEAPNGDIYIGGSFINAGGVPDADYLCKWDGTAISAVVAGFNGYIVDLCFDANGDLFVGGGFTNVGGVNGDCIVKITDLEGTPTINSLGTGANGAVWSLAVDPATGFLYAGGEFTSIGGVANTSRIAYWNGSAWNAMATGLNSTVVALEFSPDGNLYIGGYFTNADGTNGDYICYWDGTAFNMVGKIEFPFKVYDLAFDENNYLYAGGFFENAGGDANADYLAVFKNTSWESIGGGGLNNAVYKVYYLHDKLYICGNFTQVGDLSLTDRVAVWSNGAWQPFEIDLPGTSILYSIMETSQGELWIGGNYTGTIKAGKAVNHVPSSGTANVYPVIKIKGPGVLQSIVNHTTGQRIAFKDLTLLAGETIRINCDPTNLQFTSTWKGRGNLFKYVNQGSDFSNFYITPDRNYISLLMPSGTDANTRAFIEWTPKFWSIEGARYG